MERDENAEQWIEVLRQQVEKKSIVLLRLSKDEFATLLESKRGITEFTMAKRHSVLTKASSPCLVLIFAIRPDGYLSRSHSRHVAYAAVLASKGAVTSLDTRIKVKRSVLLDLQSAQELARSLDPQRFATDLTQRLATSEDLITLSPKLSLAIVDALLAVEPNRPALRSVTAGLHRAPAGSIEAVQFDAVETALKAFGLSVDSPASELALASRAKSSLARARVFEDGVIEHDARTVPGYDFIESHVTGKAVFRKGEQTLEVYTANRRNLEEAFGVDLVYVNRFHSNVVMIQYKMLEPNRGDGEPTDWIYHEDNHIGKQIRTMHMFASAKQEMEEYRLNSDPFYFKFIRRQGPSGRTNVLLPLSHFKSLLEEPDFRTRSGAVKVNYNVLKGRYLRQAAFFSLIQCGYIGSDIETSRHLRALVEDAVDGGKALVWAVQRKTREAEREAERVRQVRLYEERLDEEF